jgi:DNA-binding MarR family transcriptional regulator
LELLGLLERARDTADQRSVRLALTRKGRALQAKAAGVHAEICAAAGLTDTRRAALVSQLRRLADELESAAG